MAILLGIVLVILIIIIIKKEKDIEKLLKENIELKMKIKYLKEKIKEENDDTRINELIKETNQKSMLKSQDIQELKYNEPVDFVKQEINKKEQKNVMILITGAVCIVLSAIVFLMSTWGITSNILKTIVLGFLTFVFFKMSSIAQKKYKLDKASKVFYYIAMAYIPICFLSISIFELFGRYLSIYGEGKYIYLTVTTLILTYIYYIKRKDKYLLYGSILSQMLTVILFTLIFSNSLIVIGINMLIYNILLMTLTKDYIFVKMYSVIPWAILLIPVLEYTKHLMSMSVLLLLLTINFWIFALKSNKKIYLYTFEICLMSIGIYIITLLDNFLTIKISYILKLIYIILIYIFENILWLSFRNRRFIDTASMVAIGTLVIFYILNLFNNVIASYIIAIVQLMVVIVSYINTHKHIKKVFSYLIPVCFIICGLDIIRAIEGGYKLYLILGILILAITELIRGKNKELHLKCFISSHIYIIIAYLIVYIGNIGKVTNDLIYMVFLMLIYSYSYRLERKNIFKYVAYIVSNLVLYSFFTILNVGKDIVYYVPAITTIGIMSFEKVNNNLNNIGIKIYLGIAQIVSFIYLYNDLNHISVLVAIILASLFIVNNIKNNEILYNSIPILCLIPAIFGNDFSFIVKDIMMILFVSGITLISLKERRISWYTIFSAIYLVMMLTKTESVFIREILFIVWSSINAYCIIEERAKDIFKCLAYIGILLLYNTTINYININSYTVINMLGYMLFSVIGLKTILNKYIEDINVIECITYITIYIVAITQYNNEIDGILFGALLMFIIMISYFKKYGILFLVSIFALLVNIFVLTRKFWFSIPWWGYLLGVGIILISFAIRNEANDKRNINAIDTLKKIKDKIEE